MKKILITGGAGFIGNEIIKLIKNKKIITIVDKKKDKLTLSKFKKLGIKYISGNLIDKNFSKKIYKKASIIFHLAGETKVPSTDINLDLKKEKKIYFEATTKMQNLIKYSSKNSKIIFPSTHLVFENYKKNRIILNENSKPKPNLAYSTSKLKCEQLLVKNKRNYIILRLGSVYGPTLKKRMFNLPNLFAIRAKNNLNLKLFSKGIQIKCIVSVKDVARAMIYFSKYYKKKVIFNLVSEHFTVREIAKICKKYNNEVKLISTYDKIPYKGFYISSKKIKQTNFHYKYNYNQFAKEYIN